MLHPLGGNPDGGFSSGSKNKLNETLAYLDLARLPATDLGPRSRLIMTYALCGFANFGSLGIMIGGMGSMAPERKEEIVALGLKSIVYARHGHLYDRQRGRAFYRLIRT